MAARAEFLKDWMAAEASQRISTAGRQKASYGDAGERKSRTDDSNFEMAPTPPAFVPFADMDYWYLTKDMAWALPDSATVINVPAGFATDFASVPSMFWRWMPRVGRYGLPALVHDWLYWDQRLDRNRADDIFATAMGDLGVSAWRRFAINRAVGWYGGKYWDENTIAKKNGEGRVLKIFPTDARVTWQHWRKQPGVFG